MVPDINLRLPSSVCLCICGPRIFRFTPQDAARLSDIFNRISLPMIMSNLNTKFFTFGEGGGGGGGGGGGVGSTPTCYAQHTYFSFLKS